MQEKQPQGGAASSLGAHSKDSVPGQPGTQSGTNKAGTSQSGSSHGQSKPGEGSESSTGSWQSTAGVAEQAREGMERVKSTVRDAAEQARDTISTRGGQAMESTGQMVRDQPFMALAVTGIACFAIGMMVGRGRD